jgi:hypothetical protein
MNLDVIIGLGLVGGGLVSVFGHYRLTKERKWLVLGLFVIMCGTILATWDYFYKYALAHR